MPTDAKTTYDWLLYSGALGAALTLIWALYTRRLHWHTEFLEMKEQMSVEYNRMKDHLESQVQELREERNEFKEMVINSQRLAAKSIDIASETAKTKRER